MIDVSVTAQAFRDAYGAEPAVIAQAPGRVNLIGEHVDYADGCVLPLALSRGVSVAAGPGRAGRIRVHSDQYLDAGVAEVDPHQPPPTAYTAFVHALALETRTTGADLAVCADLPVERGWSSSAAFAVAVSAALLALDPPFVRPGALELCQLCQRAERKALGVDCGLMDQYVALFGRTDAAVLFDTWKLKHEYTPLSLGEGVLVVVDSGQPRRLAESGYNERRNELRAAIVELERRVGEFSSLRELDPAKLKHELTYLSAVSRHRLRHIITEQERVLAFVEALKHADLLKLGELLGACHSSLRVDYEVSTPELDLLADKLHNEPGIYGARLVGGGFGGGVLALMDQDAMPDRVPAALQSYEAATGLKPSYERVFPGGGATVQLGDAPPELVREWLS